MTDKDFPQQVALVLDTMLASGCPCRYSRFRASCERDSKEVGAPGYTTWEQTLLVRLFEDKVPRRDIRVLGHNIESGVCRVCGASYLRTSVEYFRDAWIEKLEIKPVLPDLGAPLHSSVPHCCPFYAAGPHGRKDELHLLNLHYPQLPEHDWLEWLSERAEG